MSDTILERVARGDRTAVAQCIDRYGALVWSIARRMSASAADAEDAVQEVFIHLWKVAERYQPSLCAEPTFIAMIARRRLIDLKRRRARHEGEETLGEDYVSKAQSHELALEVGDDAAKARKALGELRPDQQRVLQLSIYDGLSHQEIAQVTGLPLGTVKTHARRGLARVRELLGLGPARANEVLSS